MNPRERLLSAAVTFIAVLVFILPWSIALTHALHRMPRVLP